MKVYDFIGPLGKVAPYGVYDVTLNNGFVNVGISHDTAEFAVASLRRWWESMGVDSYHQARKLFVTADGFGLNGYRVRLWKMELQNLANDLGKVIHVSHYPPGTSKWNKIEHRMFNAISENWRGIPLMDYETIVSLLNHTNTEAGLTIRAMLDERTYETGKNISDEELASVNIYTYTFHGEWNYKISPQKPG